MKRVLLVTNTHPESGFIDYVRALISGDHYQLMPKRIRAMELQIQRGKPVFRKILTPIAIMRNSSRSVSLIW